MAVHVSQWAVHMTVAVDAQTLTLTLTVAVAVIVSVIVTVLPHPSGDEGHSTAAMSEQREEGGGWKNRCVDCPSNTRR